MLIETNPFRLTRRAYFGILTRLHFRRVWWFYLGVCALVPIFWAQSPDETFTVAYTVVAVFFLVWAVWRCRSLAYAVENEPLFRERRLAIDDKAIRVAIEDGTGGEMRLADVNRVLRGSNYWLLYVTRTQFVYLPDAAFKTDADRSAVAELVRLHHRGR